MPKDEATDVFAELAEKRRQVLVQLSGRPVEHVIGHVGACSMTALREKDGRWALSFGFDCWRIPPGQVKIEPLTVHFSTTREKADSPEEGVKAYSFIGIRARVIEESVFGTPQAEIVEFLGDVSDAELSQTVDDLQKPVIYQDQQFGQFTLNREAALYTGHAKWNGADVELNVTLDGSGTIDAVLQTARILCKRQKHWTKRIEDYAVQKLLPLKNECWLDEGEAALTEDAFRACMVLEGISVGPNGSFDFWHNDGDMFLGHCIQIGGNLTDGPTRADIAG